MISSIKRIVIFLVILTFIAFTAIYFYSHDRTYFNSDDETGNTPGNIYNGGLFSERNGKIYFSNDNDDGSLYVMNSDCTNISKVNDDKATYINVDDNYIYYIRANNTKENKPGAFMTFYNTGIYRVNKNGTHFKMISGNPGSYLTLHGNFLYYQNYDVNTGLYLYRNRIDAKLQRLLIEDAVIPAAILDNKMYYSGYSTDHNIDILDLSSFTTNIDIEGNFAYPIINGNYIYYMDLSDDYKIKRMNLDGFEFYYIS